MQAKVKKCNKTQNARKKKTKYEPALTIRISKFRKLDLNTTLSIILSLIKQKKSILNNSLITKTI